MTNHIFYQKGISVYLAVIVMSIILTTALTLSAILLSQIQIMREIGNSAIAFFAADTGIEKTLYYDNKIIPPVSGATRGLCGMDSSCFDCNFTTCVGCGKFGPGCAENVCDDCTLIYESNLDDKTFRVQAGVSGGVTTMESVGKYQDTKRAIEVKR